MLDKDNVTKLFEYCEDSGTLRWKVNVSPSARAGSLVSHKDKDGYLIVRYKRKAYKAHRVVWLYKTGSWPNGVIDHINGIPYDNRWVNIRDVSVKENTHNITKPKGKNRVCGVSISCGTYLAMIRRDGVSHYLGRYHCWWDAVCARKSAENRY